MSINFLPNDPQDTDLPMRLISPRPNRPPARASLAFINPQPAENTYDPTTQSTEFLFWQTREAALAALEAWDDISGSPFARWQDNRRRIKLFPDAGVDLNAFYNRESLSFFHFTTGGKTFLSGASTDVVAHETGHGILDAIRPEFWDSSSFEVNAFHEAFGDCVAILTALHDGTTRTAVLSSLTKKNFVETTAENLAAGIKAVRPDHNAALPRHARNTLKWQLPATLPDFDSAGDGPGKLINEIHSFGQVFSGCFYDTIVNIFQANGAATEASLLAAARTAGRLLAKAVATAPPKSLFFREIGRAMVKADEEGNAAANRNAIKNAFEGHDIPLGTGAMLAPVFAIAGSAPDIKGATASLATNVKKDVLRRMNAVGGKAVTRALHIGGEPVAELIHKRLVPLDHLHKKLKGVVALATEAVLIGESGGRAAVLGALPEPEAAADDVETFVRSLVRQGAIAFDGMTKKSKPMGIVAGGNDLTPPLNAVTHTIKKVGGKNMLTRFRFACRCCRRLL